MKLILSAIVLAGMFGAAQAMDGPMAGNTTPGHAASSGSEMQSTGGQMGHKSDHKGKKADHMQGGAMQHSGSMRSDHMMSGGAMQHSGAMRSNHMMSGSMQHTGSMQGGAMQKKHHDAPDQDN